MMRKLLTLAAAAWLYSASSFAYITSAVLEYSVDDTVAFHLSGNTVLERSMEHPFDFAVLSTSDGTLPLHYFRFNEKNLLAVENFNDEGGHMQVSYRLTVHHSNGDPVVIWSEPGKTKFLHLRRDEPNPEGWTQPEFDDSKWKTAVAGYFGGRDGQFVSFFDLPDKAFSNALGIGGTVPHVSHKRDSLGNGFDHNLFRSEFYFPNTPDRVRAYINPKEAAKGRHVAVRLVPGKDAVYFDQFRLWSELPRGINFTKLQPGYHLDREKRRLSWGYDSKDRLKYHRLGVSQVLSANGWAQPNIMLGKEKEGKVSRQLNIPDDVWNNGARFWPNQPAWFRLEQPFPQIQDGPAAPRITGVIFHAQARAGGTNTLKKENVDHLLFNYSVDGGKTKALEKDVVVSRSSISDRWYDAYYDATEDRQWTWRDINNMATWYMTRAVRQKDRTMMASSVMVVQYFQPLDTSPVFYVQVAEPNCAELEFKSGITQRGRAESRGDVAVLKANPHLCAPTPTPIPTPLPTNTPVRYVPPTLVPTPVATPTEVPASMLASQRPIGLGCLQASPNPFKRGGTFIFFCLKSGADITVNIYDGRDGKLVREMKVGYFGRGDHQVFFNARDKEDNAVPKGSYIYEVLATTNDGRRQTSNSQFRRE